MVILCLRECADVVHEGEGADEVGEAEFLLEMMLALDAPAVAVRTKSVLEHKQRRAVQRRDTALAGNALLGREIAHAILPA
jgi:hypothetical protein